MMAEKRPPHTVTDRPLSELLDAVIISHKQDIHAYSGGHLNESNLYKAPELANHKPWPGAHGKQLKSQKKIVVAPPSKQHNTKPMSSALVNFSVGTSGALPKHGSNKYQRLRLKEMSRPSYTSDGRSTASFSENSYKDDGVLTEELYPPETMLPNQSPVERHKLLTAQIIQDDTMVSKPKPLTQSEIRDRNLLNMKHKFIPHHVAAITKKDQYRKFMDFESDVLRKSDALEKHTLTGQKAVEHLEQKLKMDLGKLQYDGYGPNFHRLQVYSDILEQLSKETPTFSRVLKQIKEEYDEYIATLLYHQPQQHRVLQDQVQQLTDNNTSRPEELKLLKRNVEKQELQAKRLLDKNERLREELQCELELAAKVTDGLSKPKVFQGEVKHSSSISDKIEELQSLIMDKLDALNAERDLLHREFVPLSVCSHIEQCIKETEIEIQKLSNQNEYLGKDVTSMEDEITKALDEEEISDRDKRKIWNKIIPQEKDIPMLHQFQPSLTIYSDQIKSWYDDIDIHDDDRWDWYIS